MGQRVVTLPGCLHTRQQSPCPATHLQPARQLTVTGDAAIDAIHHHGDDLVQPPLDLSLRLQHPLIIPHHLSDREA